MTRLAPILAAMTFLLPYGLVAPFATTPSNPVSVELLSPVAGSTVSNVITLSANATSLAGPIARVEFYVTDNTTGIKTLIGIVTNRPPSPQNLQVQ